MGRAVSTALGLIGAAAVVVSAALLCWRQVDRLTAPAALSASEAVAALASVVALSALTWLLLVAAVAVAAHVPGWFGAGATTLSAAITPLVIRRVIALALSLGTSSTVGVAHAATSTPPVSAVAGAQWAGHAGLVSAAAGMIPDPNFDAPTLAGGPGRPELAPTPGVQSKASAVVVKPGDTLWGIAERSLGGTATPRKVAQLWPRWFAANRNAIRDPNLIYPGQVLTPPERNSS